MNPVSGETLKRYTPFHVGFLGSTLSGKDMGITKSCFCGLNSKALGSDSALDVDTDLLITYFAISVGFFMSVTSKRDSLTNLSSSRPMPMI